MWRRLNMYEVWDILTEDYTEQQKNTFLKPKFPTRRWGDITTKEATTDKISIERCLSKLREGNTKCRKRINKTLTEKFKSFGKKLYYIEIKNKL